ncbi:MAG: dethiobiotin synthase [Candidatus Omnitrophica bacterium]|nr:dethiobiotin synthase [Candidatus Omnitrophota bacterium]
MNAVFVAGTDTGVGKSLIIGLLLRYLKGKGCSAITQKWVETGSYKGYSRDIQTHLRIAGIGKIAATKRGRVWGVEKYVCPYVFKLAASAHLAAQEEKRRIDIRKIKNSFTFLKNNFGFVIVEGIGGLLVPFNRKRLALDLVKELGLSLILVAENKLGAINHTLLSIEALTSRKIRILGIIFNNAAEENSLILKDNPCIVRKISGQEILGVLPFSRNIDVLYAHFQPIARKLCRKLEI